MKLIQLLTVMIIFSLPIDAEELCNSWIKKDNPDQMPEDLFTAKQAFEAVEFLEDIKAGREKNFTEGHIGNAKIIIKGYKLKRAAKESISKNEGNKLTKEGVKFCEFIAKEAFFKD